jgi:hypothetical protein
MSRKVYIDAEVIVSMPVKAKVSLIVHADDTAAVGKVVKQWAKGKRVSEAEVTVNEMEVLAVGKHNQWDDYTDVSDWLAAELQDRLNDGQMELLKAEVTDSK